MINMFDKICINLIDFYRYEQGTINERGGINTVNGWVTLTSCTTNAKTIEQCSHTTFEDGSHVNKKRPVIGVKCTPFTYPQI